MKKGENCTNSFWIGLLEDEVEWADKGQSTYRNWMFSNPNLNSNSQYPEAYMDSSGNWYRSNSDVKYPLCYSKSTQHFL